MNYNKLHFLSSELNTDKKLSPIISEKGAVKSFSKSKKKKKTPSDLLFHSGCVFACSVKGYLYLLVEKLYIFKSVLQIRWKPISFTCLRPFWTHVINKVTPPLFFFFRLVQRQMKTLKPEYQTSTFVIQDK